MANALGELFKDQADAIREGLGDIGKIKPIDTPEKIREIVALIGTGSGDSEGGTSSGTIGEMKFASGSFRNKHTTIADITDGEWEEFSQYGASYKYTGSEESFTLSPGSTYLVEWGDQTTYPTAQTVGTLGPYSNCVVIGNKSLVTGLSSDETSEGFVVIYLPSNNTIVCRSKVFPTRVKQLKIISSVGPWGTKAISHGMREVPDFILVYGSWLHRDHISTMWGFKSSFSAVIEKGLSGYSAFGLTNDSATIGLDNGSAGKGYIYCPDNTTFIVGNSDTSKNIVLGNGTYYWIALSGLGGAINIVDANLQTKTITENGTYLPDDGYNGFSKVTVAMPTEEPVLGELNITENGTYLPGEGLDGYSKVVVNVEGASSVTEVFPETELPFALNPDYGLYVWSAIDNVFPLAEGKEYVVVWDGTAYTCTAKSAVFITSAGVGVGNFAMAGIGENTGEPFLLGVTADGSAVLCFTTETDESHTVRIYQKASAGGGVEVCYVTFMSHDGVTELYKKAVIPGDNCMNPVEMGWLDAPAKNPTNTEVFTFDGWSDTAGGSADTANVLAKVSADKTVYAAYTASTRYYTVRFFDGDTLLNTMQVKYGATANYTAEKDGANFDGWEPSNKNITADTDCYAQWSTGPVFINSGTWGSNITWGLTEDGYFELGGTGAMDNFSNGSARPWFKFRNDIVTAKVGNGITGISQHTFSACTNLKSVELPNSITVIPMAFVESGLTEIVIPESVTTIESMAFENCKSLTSLTIPASVTTIGNLAFDGSGLTSIVIPDTVTTVGNRLFMNCGSLVSVTMPQAPWRTCYNCPNLTTVTLTDGCANIGNEAFSGCTSLAEITIPGGVNLINKNAFSNSGLTRAIFKNQSGWFVADSDTATSGTAVNVADASVAATNLKTTYVAKYWKRS